MLPLVPEALRLFRLVPASPPASVPAALHLYSTITGAVLWVGGSPKAGFFISFDSSKALIFILMNSFSPSEVFSAAMRPHLSTSNSSLEEIPNRLQLGQRSINQQLPPPRAPLRHWCTAQFFFNARLLCDKTIQQKIQGELFQSDKDHL